MFYSRGHSCSKVNPRTQSFDISSRAFSSAFSIGCCSSFRTCSKFELMAEFTARPAERKSRDLQFLVMF